MTDPTPADPAAPTPAPPPAAAPPPAPAPAATTWSPPAATPAGARPTGITILAILAGLGAVGGLFSGFVIFGLGATIFGGAGAILGLAFLALAGLSLALAWGFWNMLPWAWPLGVALEAANIIFTLIGVIFAGTGVGGAVVPIVVAGAILYYLNQPSIKSLFGRA